MLRVCVSEQFEADRRAFIITMNSFETDLSGADRSSLYPSCGKLYPGGLQLLSKAEDPEQVRAVADCYPVSLIWNDSVGKAAGLLMVVIDCHLNSSRRTINSYLLILS